MSVLSVLEHFSVCVCISYTHTTPPHSLIRYGEFMQERQRKKEEKSAREKEASQRATASGKTRGKKTPGRPTAQFARTRTYASSSATAGTDGQPKRTSSKINYGAMAETFGAPVGRDSSVSAIPAPMAGQEAPVPVSALAGTSSGARATAGNKAKKSTKAKTAAEVEKEKRQQQQEQEEEEEEEELEEVVEEARADTGETYENIDDVEELDEDEYYDSADDYGED